MRRRNVDINNIQVETALARQEGRYFWHVSCDDPPRANWLVMLDAQSGKVTFARNLLATGRE